MVVIVTMNVRGLRDDKKRKEMFLFCKKMRYDIMFMQETHLEQCDEVIWRNEWGHQMFFPHGDNFSKGVAILVNKNVNVQWKNIVRDPKGRYIVCDVVIDEKQLNLVNVYAPNEDRPSFFSDLFEVMSECESVDRVVAGDFNLVLDINADSHNRKVNNDKSVAIVKTFMEEALMIDIWRNKNPNIFQFTYFKRKPREVFARLDYIFVNFALVNYVKTINIKPSYKTGHCTVALELETVKGWQRGSGFWKLNTSIILQYDNVQEINGVIENALDKAQNSMEDKSLIWEYVKEAAIKKCQQIAKLCACRVNKIIQKLIAQLDTLQPLLKDDSLTEDQKEKISCECNEYEARINRHMEYKARGARVQFFELNGMRRVRSLQNTTWALNVPSIAIKL